MTNISAPLFTNPSLIQNTTSENLNPLNHAIDQETTQRIENTAKEFEALVLSQLLAPIFATVKQSELTGGGAHTESFQALLTEEYAKSISDRGGLGIADQVKDSMLKLQAALG